MPGSPSTPLHSNPSRLAYALVAVLVGLTGGLGNALFSANLAAIQGGSGTDACPRRLAARRRAVLTVR